jgi:long-chain acyl-CoA synthetase
VNQNERILSYLPLAHIAERALVEASAFFLGFHLSFVESIDTFQRDLKRARPTIFFSVPRLYMKFQQGVLAKIPQRKLDRYLRTPILNRIVQRRILRELGLGDVRFAASGGAALPLGTLLWYRKLGLNLLEGYGMTETGITHTPEKARSHPGYVGNAVPGVVTKLSAEGEVLIHSPMDMIGYYKDPEATKRAFTEDGFFRTGDLGEIDADGWLKIIGRMKEQFKTSKGKYVSPTPIEKLLSAHPAVEACCVTGEGLSSAFAIILLAQDLRDQVSQAKVRQSCEKELAELREQVNAQLEAHEQLKFIVVTTEPWTVANGMLTPTMKLKRSVLEHRYAKDFQGWSSQGCAVVWHNSEFAAAGR